MVPVDDSRSNGCRNGNLVAGSDLSLNDIASSIKFQMVEWLSGDRLQVQLVLKKWIS